MVIHIHVLVFHVLFNIHLIIFNPADSDVRPEEDNLSSLVWMYDCRTFTHIVYDCICLIIYHMFAIQVSNMIYEMLN